MRIARSSLVSIIMATALVAILHIDGIFRYVFLKNHRPGSINPQLAAVLLVIFGIIYIYKVFIPWLARGLPVLGKNTFLMASALSVLVIFGHGGELNKVARDISYLMTMWLCFAIIRAYNLVFHAEVGKFLAILLISSCIILPSLHFFIFQQDSGRFGGFMLSEPIFANSMVMIMTMAFSFRLSRELLVIGSVFSGFWIFMSGTRTAMFLFLLLLGYVWLFDFGRRCLTWKRGMIALVLFMSGLGVFITTYAQNAEAMADVRVLSVSDMEGGSLATRTLWYGLLFNRLMTERMVGGFGAGSSEAYIGEITHFDFLRFWHDYSIAYLVLFLCLLYQYVSGFSGKITNSLSKYVFVGFLCLSVTLFSMHNIFQSPSGVLMVAIMVSIAFVRHG